MYFCQSQSSKTYIVYIMVSLFLFSSMARERGGQHNIVPVACYFYYLSTKKPETLRCHWRPYLFPWVLVFSLLKRNGPIVYQPLRRAFIREWNHSHFCQYYRWKILPPETTDSGNDHDFRYRPRSCCNVRIISESVQVSNVGHHLV